MHELTTLHNESYSPSHRQDKLQVVRDILGVLMEVCSDDQTAVSAGAVAESYTRSKKNLVPESFVPVRIMGPEDIPTTEEDPITGVPMKKGQRRSSPPKISGTPDIPALQQQPVESTIDPPAMSDISRSPTGPTLVEKSVVENVTSKKPRPLSFDIDWSKMTPDSSYPVPGILNWPAVTDPPVSMLANAKAFHASSQSQDSPSDSDRIDRYLRSLQGNLFCP